jgi:hypothetical protein
MCPRPRESYGRLCEPLGVRQHARECKNPRRCEHALSMHQGFILEHEIAYNPNISLNKLAQYERTCVM